MAIGEATETTQNIGVSETIKFWLLLSLVSLDTPD